MSGLGVWANSATSIMIRDRRGLIIEPADEHCNNLNEADYVGDTIVVHTGPDGKGAENFSLRISRRGPLLKIEEVPPARRGKAPPQHACTVGGVISGIYFQKSRYLKAILTVHPPPRAYARGTAQPNLAIARVRPLL